VEAQGKLTAPHEPQFLELPSDEAPHLGQAVPCMVSVMCSWGLEGKGRKAVVLLDQD